MIERFELSNVYASEIAPTGHPPAQEPQLIQVLESISNFPSPSLIAPTGHCPAQAPQEIQESPITYAMIKSSLNMSVPNHTALIDILLSNSS